MSRHFNPRAFVRRETLDGSASLTTDAGPYRPICRSFFFILGSYSTTFDGKFFKDVVTLLLLHHLNGLLPRSRTWIFLLTFSCARFPRIRLNGIFVNPDIYQYFLARNVYLGLDNLNYWRGDFLPRNWKMGQHRWKLAWEVQGMWRRERRTTKRKTEKTKRYVENLHYHTHLSVSTCGKFLFCIIHAGAKKGIKSN